MKKVYVLLGDPVEHSLSPQMQTEAFKAAGIDAEYLKTRVKPDGLENAIRAIRTLEIAGANITIPHKIEVMKYLDEIDPLAESIGAVNTIVNKDGKLIGYNTDGLGALESLDGKTEGKRITIMGAGGAGRAIGFTLATKGKAREIAILDRDAEKAKKLADDIPGKVFGGSIDELEECLKDAEILINCTPVGMSPNEGESLVPASMLRKNMIVFDIVYNPLRTKLVQDAEKKGCTTITGDNMLVLQGAGSFKIWTGKRPDVKLMQAIVRAAFGEERKKNIVLLGFMGTGKTSTGNELARMLGMDFIDIDDQIEKMAGMDIPTIFEKLGEKGFRELELEAVRLHSQKGGVIISAGGGVVLNMLNIIRLKEDADVFLLTASAEKIAERLRGDKRRPLLDLDNEKKMMRIVEILEHRRAFYAATGATEIKTDGHDPKGVAKMIMKQLGGGHE